MWNEWNARTRKNWWQRRVQGWRKFWNLTTLAVFCVVYQTTSIHFFPLGFPTFFFQKYRAKERVQAELKKFRQAAIKGWGNCCIWDISQRCPRSEGKRWQLVKMTRSPPETQICSMSFFVSSLFCSSYLHISTIKKHELHGFSASFFSQYPCLYRHVCTGDALHSTTCDLVDRCWPHFLLFSLAHPNQNDQPMSNL